MDTDFEGKTIIITGGSDGVGAATARKFAAAGANLVLAARGMEKLQRMEQELAPLTGICVVPMDVADADACSRLLKTAHDTFGTLHVLVNNAGLHRRGRVEMVSPSDLGAMIDVNLRAPIILSRLAIPYLRDAGSAAIINVASLAGRTPVAGSATYSASKFGLRVFTFALGEELRGSGIKLAAVSPGPIDTAFIMEKIDDVSDITFSQPLSTAEQVARVILQLAVSDKRERSMPPVSGLLTTLSYLFPWLSRALTPALERKGRRVKRELVKKMRAQEGGKAR